MYIVYTEKFNKYKLSKMREGSPSKFVIPCKDSVQYLPVSI